MSRATYVNRWFHRLAIAAGALMGIIGAGFLAAGGYHFMSIPDLSGWSQVTKGSKIVYFPPQTERATIEKVIPIIEQFPEPPAYGADELIYDPSWLTITDPRSFSPRWQTSSRYLKINAEDAAMFGLGFLLVGALLYIGIRMIGWMLARFLD